jgi:deoxyribose-phosphate aldolase
MEPATRGELARRIDHTLLTPEATVAQIETLCAEGVALGVGAVCVSPTMVAVAVGVLPSGFVVASVAGFPSGAHTSLVKAREAEEACADGAREIDMVANLSAIAQSQWSVLSAEVAEVRRAIGADSVLKVIIESAAWDDEHVVNACQAAVGGGADFIKTSTGFHSSGGATQAAVHLMRKTVGPHIGVKASGGVRSLERALEMIEAGANRIGTSSARAILAEAEMTFGVEKS